jgi:hypothetical protein
VPEDGGKPDKLVLLAIPLSLVTIAHPIVESGIAWQASSRRDDAENLAFAVLVDRHRNFHGLADDAPASRGFEVCRIQPKIGSRAPQRPGEDGVHPLVDLGAETADLALGHTARAHRLDPVIDRLRRDAVEVGFLDHRHEGFFGCVQ